MRLPFAVSCLIAAFSAYAQMPVGSALTTAGQPLHIEGYDTPAMAEERLSALPLARAEGLWEIPGDGGLIAIERASDASAAVMNIVAVLTANRRIRPGTVLGTMRPTAKPGYYEASVFTKASAAGELSAPKSFTLKLDEATASITFERNRKGVRVNWWRLLPYVFRIRVETYDTTPTDLNGLRRVYPPNPQPLQPHYL